MGVLVSADGTKRVRLLWQTLVGRLPTATLSINDGRVSSRHAELHWDGADWHVRDLGSRNGTYVDNQRLPVGTSWPLQVGMDILFGGNANAWRVEDVSPAVAAARTDSASWTFGDPRGLVLPSEAAPEVFVLYNQADRNWVIDNQSGTSQVEDGGHINVGGQMWQLSLPATIEATVDATHAGSQLDAMPRLRFQVSQDEEHVKLDVKTQGDWQALASRRHHYTMLLLARQKLQDAQEGFATGEQGWMHLEDLEKQLRLDRLTINTHVHRFRRQIQKLVTSADFEIVERRMNSGLIRLGVSAQHITIGSMVD